MSSDSISGAFGDLAVPQAASEVAMNLIRKAILTGKLAPGERLIEDELAQQLQASRTPIREALLRLANDGLVDISRNRGATVRLYEPEEIGELYEMRALLEGYAARHAAGRIAKSGLATLDDSIERSAGIAGDREGDIEELGEQNLRFHDTIIGLARSPQLESMIAQVRVLPLVYQVYAWYSPVERDSSVQYHERITRALRSRDADRAAAVMREHVLEARDSLLRHMTDRIRAQRSTAGRRPASAVAGILRGDGS
jgi:DNA-binding GntR family transcriptional regulator